MSVSANRKQICIFTIYSFELVLTGVELILFSVWGCFGFMLIWKQC